MKDIFLLSEKLNLNEMKNEKLVNNFYIMKIFSSLILAIFFPYFIDSMFSFSPSSSSFVFDI